MTYQRHNLYTDLPTTTSKNSSITRLAQVAPISKTSDSQILSYGQLHRLEDLLGRKHGVPLKLEELEGINSDRFSILPSANQSGLKVHSDAGRSQSRLRKLTIDMGHIYQCKEIQDASPLPKIIITGGIQRQSTVNESACGLKLQNYTFSSSTQASTIQQQMPSSMSISTTNEDFSPLKIQRKARNVTLVYNNRSLSTAPNNNQSLGAARIGNPIAASVYGLDQSQSNSTIRKSNVRLIEPSSSATNSSRNVDHKSARSLSSIKPFSLQMAEIPFKTSEPNIQTLNKFRVKQIISNGTSLSGGQISSTYNFLNAPKDHGREFILNSVFDECAIQKNHVQYIQRKFIKRGLSKIIDEYNQQKDEKIQRVNQKMLEKIKSQRI
ncbi:hypothetical protein FGO68_gene5459 [Halteria grandinella]|uniref:Uncharacterized protein n=1 Tax=Halteria grandinella TaxID=5974 RepID=A0A8J8T1Y7_HALGN|nr:hypothetical protein FGO68_gene5459 [Halteria grandinella]